MNKILVTPKVNPNLDGTSCALAYSFFLNKTGRDAEGIVFGSPQFEVQYFVEKHNIEIPTRPDGANENWDGYILVDASSMKGMPKVVTADKVIEIIDHRKAEPEKEFPNATIQNELIGAAATLVTERFMNSDIKLTPEHAKLLYGAIYHNTLNFIASNTSNRDRAAAKFLEKEFDLDEQLIREMFDFATTKILSNVKQALEDDAKEFGDGHSIGAYQLIVWGSELLSQGEAIEEGVKNLSSKLRADWAFLNLIDLENKRSHIFCANDEGMKVLEKAMNCKFTKGWCELDKAWLRKQIMPKVLEALK